MTIKKLTNREKEAIARLEYLQGFVEGKAIQKMPIFSDELKEVWLTLETAIAMIESRDYD
jgi:hypothetical protein